MTLPPDTEELETVKAAHQNCVSTSALDEQIKQREVSHKAKLQRERDDISRLKIELEKSQSQKSEAERAVTEEKQLRIAETRKLQETLDETEQRANLAEQKLETLKAKPEQWLKELAWINSEMASKFLLAFF